MGVPPRRCLETAVGGAGGITFKSGSFSLHGSGYYGSGLGTTLMFGNLGQDPQDGDLATSYGGYGQVSFNPSGSKATVAASYGTSSLTSSDAQDITWKNSLISGGLYYQATKSLKMVFEGDYMMSDISVPGSDPDGNTAFTGAFGLMLFY